MTTRVAVGGPPTNVYPTTTAARVTPEPARPFQQVMNAGSAAIVSGAEAAVNHLPGGTILAAAMRPGGSSGLTPSYAPGNPYAPSPALNRAEGPTGTATSALGSSASSGAAGGRGGGAGGTLGSIERRARGVGVAWGVTGRETRAATGPHGRRQDGAPGQVVHCGLGATDDRRRTGVHHLLKGASGLRRDARSGGGGVNVRRRAADGNTSGHGIFSFLGTLPNALPHRRSRRPGCSENVLLS